MAVLYAQLANHYPSSNPASRQYISQKALFESMGWEEFLNNPNYANTCAIRVSLALNKAGLYVSPGSHRILKGPDANRKVEVSMKKLADLLTSPRYFGKPEVFKKGTVAGIGARKGLIAFHRIPGYAGGGHIDLFDGAMPNPTCLSACYASEETWFWPLK